MTPDRHYSFLDRMCLGFDQALRALTDNTKSTGKPRPGEKTSESPLSDKQRKQAALEEGDHLLWCRKRLDELGSHTSYLNPLWYAGSFCIGMAAGMVGDAWSLGFVVETERQVIKHIESHLQKLPKNDERSHDILVQMEKDEAKHRDEAIHAGARELPSAVKTVMGFTSKIMVKTAHYI